MGGYAWVTLATNDSYSLGALVLANSLKQVGTGHQLAVLVTPGVTSAMRQKLSATFNLVQEVNILDSKDEANLRLLKRPELGVTFTKLHCWRLTQFDKCVFLDADTLVLRNCDELFDREELSAAPDVGWPDCFNSGVFVYRPSNETYEKLVQFALEKGSFDGGDQGLLNLYFSDWATKDISKHLPFIYNLCSTACYSYLPAFKQFGVDAKIVHFIGSSKPWLQYFNTETRKVQPSSDLKHLEGILQHWWNIFCSLIHPQLTTEMARSSSDVTHTSMSSCTSQNYDKPQISTKNIVWDPWEEYDQKQSQIFPQVHSFPEEIKSSHSPIQHTQETHIPSPTHQTQPVSKSEPSQIKPVESHNTNAYASYEHRQSPIQDHFQKPEILLLQDNNPPLYSIQQPHVYSVEASVKPVTPPPPPSPPPPIVQNYTPPTSLGPIYSSQDSQLQSQLLICAPNPASPIPHVHSNESEAAATVCKEPILHVAPNEDEFSSGLAGAFAQLTLGAARTAEQSALDDHLRRQGWEVGNIDYMGRDSFDNIWSKICETLSAGLPPAPKTTEATPSPTVRQSEKSANEGEAQLSPQTVPQDSTSTPVSQSIPLEQPQTISESKASSETPTTTPVASEGSPAESGDLQSQLKVAEQPKEIPALVQLVTATEPPIVPICTSEEVVVCPRPPQSSEEAIAATPSQEGQASVSPPAAPVIQPSTEAAPTAPPSSEAPGESKSVAETPLPSQPSSETPSASIPSSAAPATPQPSIEAPAAPQLSSEIAASSQPPKPTEISSSQPPTEAVAASKPTEVALSQLSSEAPPAPVPTQVAPSQPSSEALAAPQPTEVAPSQPSSEAAAAPQPTEVAPSQPSSEAAAAPSPLPSSPPTEALPTSPLSTCASPVSPPSTEIPPASKAVKEVPPSTETPPTSPPSTEVPSPKLPMEASKPTEAPSTQPSAEIPPISSPSTEAPPSPKSPAEIPKPDAPSSPPTTETPPSQLSTEAPPAPKPTDVTASQPSTEAPPTGTASTEAVLASQTSPQVPPGEVKPEAPAPQPSSVAPPTSKSPPQLPTPPKTESPAASETDKPKSGAEQSKGAPKAKVESTSATSSASPTPPPRKTAGGGKKKAKK